MPIGLSTEERARIAPLLPKANPSSRSQQDWVLARTLSNFLGVRVEEVIKIAGRMGVLRKRRLPTHHNKGCYVTWQGAEKIMIIIRERQGELEVKRIERSFIRHDGPSGQLRRFARTSPATRRERTGG